MNDIMLALATTFIAIPAGALVALIVGNFVYLTYHLFR